MSDAARVENGFWPPYCPNVTCLQTGSDRSGGFLRHGYYSRHACNGRVPRFICRRCRRTMSSQTFAESYRLRHPDLEEAILRQMAQGGSLRSIARILGVNRKTVSRRLARARRGGVTMGAQEERLDASARVRREAIPSSRPAG